MIFVTGRAVVDDIDTLVADLRIVADNHGVTIQAFDARYIVDRKHLEQATRLADRAIERDKAIADERAIEILCYAAGTRQIEVALEIGVSEGNCPVIVLIDGDDEKAAAESIKKKISINTDPLGTYDEERVKTFYSISDTELNATNAGIPALVHERVALLVVER